MKRIALLLVVLAACKTTDSAPAPAASDPAPTAAATTTKRGPAPSLAADPTLPAAPTGEDTMMRHRHDRGAKDLDGDGKISPEERLAAHKERSEKMRAKWDTNGDGKLTPDELGAIQGGMKFADPAAIDTNHDGDISADELSAAMEARHQEMRAQRGMRAAGSDAPPAP